MSIKSWNDLVEEEEELAQSLKDVCTPYGDERKSKLTESSTIFLKYGRLYMRKAELSDGMEQKLNYVKSAALLFAAKARFEIICDDSGRCEAINAVKQIHTSIVDSCGGRNADIIMKTSTAVKRRFEELRKIQQKELNQIPIIKEDIEKKESIILQKKKIATVKRLLEKNTKDFKELMKFIASKCLQILDKLPCDFAIAGLGSLSKGEVTLYSDFEHIILLEEGVHDEKVLEYFRWFAVLFQVTIIGLGETMIPSVGVKSLNDLCFKDRRVNWFYDFYTPSGVAIDGMMPHACKSPLGRQYPTPSKNHIVELIKPVSKILSYLSSSEDLKNGYHLMDILRQSCYVYGSENIFDYFSTSVSKILQAQNSEDIWKAVNALALDNINDITRGNPSIRFGSREIDCKSLLYRPLSTCLGYLRWANKLNRPLGFHVISGLKRIMGGIAYIYGRPSIYHSVKWAFAVACEMRMKVYAVGGGSRQRVIRGDIQDYIGKSCLVNCIKQALEYSKHFKFSRRRLLTGREPRIMLEGENVEMATSYMVLGDLKRAKPCLLRDIEYLENEKYLNSLERQTLQQCYKSMGTIKYFEWLDSGRKDHSLLQEAEQYIMRYPLYLEDSTACGVLIRIYFEKKNYLYALKTCEDRVIAMKSKPLRSAMRFRMNQVRALLQCYTPSEAIQYCEKSEKEFHDMGSRLAFQFGSTVSRIKQGGDKQKLLDLLDLTLKEGTKEVSKLRILGFIEEIFRFQYQNFWFDDAIKSLEAADLIMESRVQYVDPEGLKALRGLPAAMCYLNMIPQLTEYRVFLDTVSKVMKICLLLENRKSCDAIYIEVLKELLNRAIANPHKFIMSSFIEHYRTAPFQIQGNGRIQNHLKFALFHVFAQYFGLAYSSCCLLPIKKGVTGFSQNVSSVAFSDGRERLVGMLELHSRHLITLIENFPFQISHPLLSNQLHSIYFKVLYWIASLIEIQGISSIKADTTKRFDHLTHPTRYHVLHEQLNEKLWHFFKFEFKSITKTIWRSCFFASHKFLPIHKLFRCVSANLNIPLLSVLRTHFLTAWPLTFEQFEGNFAGYFKAAMAMWLESNFQCAHHFWRIIHNTTHNDPVQKRSILMLVNTVFHSLGRFGYRLNINGSQFCLDPKDYSDPINGTTFSMLRRPGCRDNL